MLTRREFGLASAALAAGQPMTKEARRKAKTAAFYAALGRRIAGHRRRLGLTVEQACEAANALRRSQSEHPMEIEAWQAREAGKICYCDEAGRMAELFGVTLEELIGC